MTYVIIEMGYNIKASFRNLPECYKYRDNYQNMTLSKYTDHMGNG